MKVPEGWERKKLGEIANISSGGTPSRKKEEYWNSKDIPWVRTTEVQNSYIDKSDIAEFISFEGLRNSSAKLVPVGTILLAMIGQGKTRGQVAYLKTEAATNQNCATIVFNNNHNSDFYFHLLISKYERIRNFSNSSGQSNLSGRLVKQIQVLTPPLAEQEKIAEILSTWDRTIEQTERLKANAETHKKALMQQLLTGKKRFPEFTGKWEKKALKNLLQEIKKERVENPQDYELLTVRLHNKGIVRSGKYPRPTKRGRPYYFRYAGELIIGRQNLHNGGIGIADENVDGCIASNAISSFKAHNSDLLFMYYFMSTPRFIHNVDSTIGGTGQKEISSRELLRMKVTVPSLAEQQKIAAVLNTADREIALLTEKLDHLKTEKRALMQQLLTGERRVKVDG